MISLSIQDNIPLRADDILNTLIAQYNEDTREFLSLSTSNTLDFIDERLSILETQLGDIESEVRNYKTDNTLVDFMLQSESIIKKGSEYEAQITQLGIQLQFLDMIRDYLQDDGNEFSLLPANIGIEDQGLTTVINDYNSVVIERRRLMLGACPDRADTGYEEGHTPFDKPVEGGLPVPVRCGHERGPLRPGQDG